jgi:hypothetical protein
LAFIGLENWTRTTLEGLTSGSPSAGALKTTAGSGRGGAAGESDVGWSSTVVADFTVLAAT